MTDRLQQFELNIFCVLLKKQSHLHLGCPGGKQIIMKFHFWVNYTFKGLLHPKMIHFVINHLPPCRSKPVKSSEHNLRYLRWKSGGLWLFHWLPDPSQTINTVKAQKCIKKHYQSICHQYFNRSLRYECYEITFVVCVQQIFSKTVLRWHSRRIVE